MLCDIQTDFTGFGVSSMNEDEHILTGRPFVGTLFYGENLLQSTAPMTVTELLALNLFVILLQRYSCVYTCHIIALTTLMIICFNSARYYRLLMTIPLHIFSCARISMQILLIDLNVVLHLLQLCSDHSLCLADKLFLPTDSFTFISSSHNSTSWLDHILTTASGFSLFY